MADIQKTAFKPVQNGLQWCEWNDSEATRFEVRHPGRSYPEQCLTFTDRHAAEEVARALLRCFEAGRKFGREQVRAFILGDGNDCADTPENAARCAIAAIDKHTVPPLSPDEVRGLVERLRNEDHTFGRHIGVQQAADALTAERTARVKAEERAKKAEADLAEALKALAPFARYAKRELDQTIPRHTEYARSGIRRPRP